MAIGQAAQGGYLSNSGYISANLNGVIVTGGLGTVVNSGTISRATESGVTLAGGGTVINTGKIVDGSYAVYLGAAAGNRLVIDPDASFVGLVQAAGTGNAIEPEAGTGVLEGLGTQFMNFATIDIDAGGDWTIGGTTEGDTLRVDGFGLSDGEFQETLDANGAPSLSTGGNTLEVNFGDAAVDQVVANVGCGLPRRDLFISPGHSVLLDGVLVLASALVNGVTITQEMPESDVHYVQMELAGHDCVLAEGCWAESYADGPGLRGQFHNAAAFAALP